MKFYRIGTIECNSWWFLFDSEYTLSEYQYVHLRDIFRKHGSFYVDLNGNWVPFENVKKTEILEEYESDVFIFPSKSFSYLNDKIDKLAKDVESLQKRLDFFAESQVFPQ
jgi:hypothetical protein